jgi:hypothetical protein
VVVDPAAITENSGHVPRRPTAIVHAETAA